MSTLAEPRRRQKWTLNPRGNLWANDESKFGQKLMEKMGWEKGKGLGANQDGRLAPVTLRQKDNQKGVGYQGHDDTWLAHQEDFQAVLAALNREHGEKGSGETPAEELGKASSLEAASKSSKKRVHYQKFTRGKDISNYSTDDLGCILGTKSEKMKSKSQSEPSSPRASEDEGEVGGVEKSHGLVTIQGGNYQEYFAKKMAELKARGRPTFHSTFTQDPDEETLTREEETGVSLAALLQRGEEDRNGELELDEQNRKEKKKEKSKKNKKNNTDDAPQAHDEEDVMIDEEEPRAGSDDAMESPDLSDEKGKKKKNKKTRREKNVEADAAPRPEEVTAGDSGCEDAEAKQKKKKKGKKEKKRQKRGDEEPKSDKENEPSPEQEVVEEEEEEENKKRKRSEDEEAESNVDEEPAVKRKKSKKRRKSDDVDETSAATTLGEEAADAAAVVSSDSQEKTTRKKKKKKKNDVATPVAPPPGPEAKFLGFPGANILSIVGYGEKETIVRHKKRK